MTLGLVRNEEELVIHQFTTLVTLRCTDVCTARFQTDQLMKLRTNYLEASFEMRKTRIMRHAQQTCFTQLISPLQPCSPKRWRGGRGEKTNQKGRLADGIRQRTRRDNLNRHRSRRNLITLLDLCVSFPRCLAINRHIIDRSWWSG